MTSNSRGVNVGCWRAEREAAPSGVRQPAYTSTPREGEVEGDVSAQSRITAGDESAKAADGAMASGVEPSVAEEKDDRKDNAGEQKPPGIVDGGDSDSPHSTRSGRRERREAPEAPVGAMRCTDWSQRAMRWWCDNDRPLCSTVVVERSFTTSPPSLKSSTERLSVARTTTSGDLNGAVE